VGCLPATRVVFRKKQRKPKHRTVTGQNDVWPLDQGARRLAARVGRRISGRGQKWYGAVRNPPVEIEDSPVDPDNAPVVEGGDQLISGAKAPSTHIPPESP